jgi:hypothetical protein
VAQTEIHYDPRYDQSVKTVQAALPAAKLVATAGTGATIVVVLGSDYSAASVVRPVISKPTVSSSSTPDIKAHTAADRVCS